MMRLEADAVLFDSDGVLVDSHPQVMAAWTRLAHEYGLDTGRILVELVGRRSIDTLSEHLDPERADEACRRLEDLEVDSAVATVAVAGARELLARLPPGRFAFVTSATRRLATARWRGAGLPVPPLLITADDVTAGKPDPAPFLAGAALVGVDPRRCIVFEDSPSGGRAGLAAGATVVAVGRLEWPDTPAARVADLRHITVEAPTGEGTGPFALILPDDRLA